MKKILVKTEEVLISILCDLLKNDNSGAYFIVDSETNEIISLVDEFGDSPSFDYSNSGGTGNYSWEHTSKTYAVESSGEGDSKKYILAIKSIYTFYTFTKDRVYVFVASVVLHNLYSAHFPAHTLPMRLSEYRKLSYS